MGFSSCGGWLLIFPWYRGDAWWCDFFLVTGDPIYRIWVMFPLQTGVTARALWLVFVFLLICVYVAVCFVVRQFGRLVLVVMVVVLLSGCGGGSFFEVVVAATMMCGRGGVSVCLGVHGAVLVWFQWVVADLVSKRFADGSFFKGWLDGGCFLWWLWWGRLCYSGPYSLSLTLVCV